jgi:hypothetical protein
MRRDERARRNLFALRSRGARGLTAWRRLWPSSASGAAPGSAPGGCGLRHQVLQVSGRAVHPGTNGKIHPDGSLASAASKPPLEVSSPGNRTKSAVRPRPASGRPEAWIEQIDGPSGRALLRCRPVGALDPRRWSSRPGPPGRSAQERRPPAWSQGPVRTIHPARAR